MLRRLAAGSNGNKANPKGRGKGSKSRKVVIHDVMFEPVTVREGDRTRQMSALEAVTRLIINIPRGARPAHLCPMTGAYAQGSQSVLPTA
jgi:Family of unknown function (DUF5681)